MKLAALILSLLIVGCVSKSKWDHKGGGQAFTDSKGEKRVRVQTEWGEITLKPGQIHSQMVPVAITVKNRSESSVTLNEDSLFLKDTEGYTIAMLSRPEINQRLQAQGAFGAAVIAGNGYGSNNSAVQGFINENTKNLFRFGNLKPKSAKRGVVFFPANNQKREHLKVHFQDSLKAKATSISFKNVGAKRKPSSRRELSPL